MKKFFMMLAFAFCALVSFTACDQKDEVSTEQGAQIEEGVTVTDSQIVMKCTDAQGVVTILTLDFDADGICVGGYMKVSYMGVDTETAYDACEGLSKDICIEILNGLYDSLKGEA